MRAVVLENTQSPIPNPQSLSTVRDYIALMKPRILLMATFTGFVAMQLAPATLHPVLQAIALLALATGSGAAAVLNMWVDRHIDGLMTRTASRPLPAGRIAPEDALAFGLFLSAASIILMILAAGWLAAAWLATAILLYGWFYTSVLKRHTVYNTEIGGLPGALPPVIAWAAVTGAVSLEAWVLCLIIFLWTPPHFWSLALLRTEDYAHAGIPMFPVIHGSAITERRIFTYALLLFGASLLPAAMGFAGVPYGAVATLLGARFIYLAGRLCRTHAESAARRLFAYSIFYLFLLFFGLLLDKFIDNTLIFSFF